MTAKENVQTEKELITIGHKKKLHSQILNEEREIWIQIPENSVHSNRKFPAIYVLDGAHHFPLISSILEILTASNVCPEMIIIGIQNTDRARDLTPTNFSTSKLERHKTSGGAEKFTSFIRDELIPYIDDNYSTSNYRTIAGHSLGGLFVVNTLLKNPELFNNYIASDPSMWWWDKHSFLNEAKYYLKEQNFEGKSLFVGVGQSFDKNFDIEKSYDLENISDATKQIISNLELKKLLELNCDNGLQYMWNYYEKEIHTTVPLMVEYDAVNFLFDWYRFDELMDYYNGIDISTKDLKDTIEKYFDKISKYFGYLVLPYEKMISSLGYYYLSKDNFENSKVLFEMNIKNHPLSSNVFDSMSEWYGAQDKTKKH